jgi:hypothetical protein
MVRALDVVDFLNVGHWRAARRRAAADLPERAADRCPTARKQTAIVP